LENSKLSNSLSACPTYKDSSTLYSYGNIFNKLAIKASYFITGLCLFYTIYHIHQLYQPNRRERIAMQAGTTTSYIYDSTDESHIIILNQSTDATPIYEIYCTLNSIFPNPTLLETQAPQKTIAWVFTNSAYKEWEKHQTLFQKAKTVAAANALSKKSLAAEQNEQQHQIECLKAENARLRESAVEDSNAHATQRSNEEATQCSKEQTKHREKLHNILPNKKPTTLQHIKANITHILEIQKNMLNGSCTLTQSQLFTFGLREEVVTECGNKWDKFIHALNSRTYADGEQLALNPAQVANTIFTKAVEWQEPVLQSLIDPLHDFGLKQTPLYFDLFTAAMVDVLVDLIPTAAATEEHTTRRALRDELKAIIEYLLLFTIAESNKRKSDVRPYISTGITRFTHHIINTDAAETQSAISTSSMRSDMTGKSGKRVKRVVVNEPDYTPLLANDLIKPALSLARLIEETCKPDQIFREIMSLRAPSARHDPWTNSPNESPKRPQTPSSTASSTSPSSNSVITERNTLWNSRQSYLGSDSDDGAVNKKLFSPPKMVKTPTEATGESQQKDLKGTDTVQENGSLDSTPFQPV